jgi:sterol desaturase/sphingolipid hydroxylase (fatty acid hydroxylase superfamily)
VVAALGALTIHFAESPVVYPIAETVNRRRWGFLKRLRLPRPLEVIAALLLHDSTLYLQHVLHHRVPLLWRFHAVHHVDLDLDASTALRFHFGEVALSLPYRAAQVLVIGVDPGILAGWQAFLLLSIMFHHSNVRLPKSLEDQLGLLVVTPRLHGIHHSNDPQNQNSNSSGGLTLWDACIGRSIWEFRRKMLRLGLKGWSGRSR